ncbi:MAG: ribonuclease H [Acidimicrobiia bacterium]|nr:ribonuclease H [Acidimicrobiia bacterium]
MPDFICQDCGDDFSLPSSVLDRYPGWTPRQCRSCRDAGASSGTGTASASPNAAAVAEGADDPTTGVFTDGSSVPNPGPGGWGVVYVEDDEIIDERFGFGGDTTNNRMELTALIEAVRLVPAGTSAVVYSDSNLAVRTINEWAAGWERRGWKRKSGPVENLDLVKEAYRAYRDRPELELRWIKAHVGFKWNEYADELANRGRREGG